MIKKKSPINTTKPSSVATSTAVVEEEKRTSFLERIRMKSSISNQEVYDHCFHYLLYNDNSSLSSLTEGVCQSIDKSLTVVDRSRIQLQLVSLCFVDEDEKLVLKSELLQGVSLSSWCWTADEKTKLRLRLKGQQKREVVEVSETPSVKKRSRKAKQEVENVQTGIFWDLGFGGYR